MKAGVIFSGQGAQFPGMGNEYYNEYESSREIFDLAGEDIKHMCFEGSAEQLRETKVTQPTVFTVAMASWAALNEELSKNSIFNDRIEITGVAGFSLGEYGAYTAAEVFKDFPMGLDLVIHRGLFMSEAGQYEDGSPRGTMAAVIGNRKKIIEVVDDARGDDVLEAVNFNSPNQTAVAGDEVAIKRLREIAKANKLKAIPLSVSTAFHSPIMNKASEALYTYVADVQFSEPKYKLYSNTTGGDLMIDKIENTSTSEHIREKIARQVNNPVYWQETIENMAADGIELFIETGPGKTLSNMVKKILPNAKTFCISEPEGLRELIKFVVG